MTSLTLMLQRSNPLSVTSRKMKIMEAFSIIQAYKQPERQATPAIPLKEIKVFKVNSISD